MLEGKNPIKEDDIYYDHIIKNIAIPIVDI
jgi:hypothetical protein